MEDETIYADIDYNVSDTEEDLTVLESIDPLDETEESCLILLINSLVTNDNTKTIICNPDDENVGGSLIDIYTKIIKPESLYENPYRHELCRKYIIESKMIPFNLLPFFMQSTRRYIIEKKKSKPSEASINHLVLSIQILLELSSVEDPYTRNIKKKANAANELLAILKDQCCDSLFIKCINFLLIELSSNFEISDSIKKLFNSIIALIESITCNYSTTSSDLSWYKLLLNNKTLHILCELLVGSDPKSSKIFVQQQIKALKAILSPFRYDIIPKVRNARSKVAYRPTSAATISIEPDTPQQLMNNLRKLNMAPNLAVMTLDIDSAELISSYISSISISQLYQLFMLLLSETELDDAQIAYIVACFIGAQRLWLQTEFPKIINPIKTEKDKLAKMMENINEKTSKDVAKQLKQDYYNPVDLKLETASQYFLASPLLMKLTAGLMSQKDDSDDIYQYLGDIMAWTVVYYKTAAKLIELNSTNKIELIDSITETNMDSLILSKLDKMNIRSAYDVTVASKWISSFLNFLEIIDLTSIKRQKRSKKITEVNKIDLVRNTVTHKLFSEIFVNQVAILNSTSEAGHILSMLKACRIANEGNFLIIAKNMVIMQNLKIWCQSNQKKLSNLITKELNTIFNRIKTNLLIPTPSSYRISLISQKSFNQVFEVAKSITKETYEPERQYVPEESDEEDEMPSYKSISAEEAKLNVEKAKERELKLQKRREDKVAASKPISAPIDLPVKISKFNSTNIDIDNIEDDEPEVLDFDETDDKIVIEEPKVAENSNIFAALADLENNEISEGEASQEI